MMEFTNSTLLDDIPEEWRPDLEHPDSIAVINAIYRRYPGKENEPHRAMLYKQLGFLDYHSCKCRLSRGRKTPCKSEVCTLR